MREKRKKHPWLLCLAALLVWSMTLSGWAMPEEGGTGRMLVPVGRTVGIKLFAHGVMVVGLSEQRDTPARACGLREGDVITCINGRSVNSIEDVEAALAQSAGTLRLTATRAGRALEMRAEDVGEACKLGAWVRDSMAGIGTVTFYDPATGAFGALGHGINDVDTGLLMPLRSGSVMPSAVSAVVKGTQGQPGELHGSFDLTRDVGTLHTNTDWGIFGTGQADYFAGEPVEVARQVHTGEAVILANVEGDTVEAFDVEILRVYPAGDRQSLMLRVTDPTLLEKTGGIVQGMSGSPILQDGKLAGAVTHVLVNDPTRGYGISMQEMLAAAER